ncbi:MAG: DJ-1/PfpI family protein [Planctomycetaceae bacterium]|nr:DJ-1/PfpI family protein [Planctomycetaceae bacterium]
MSSRRHFLQNTLATALMARGTEAFVSADEPNAEQHNSPSESHLDEMRRKMPEWFGSEQIAMLLYPQFTALDIFGPHHMFILMGGAKVHLVAESKDPVPTDSGVLVTPTCTLDECPKDLSAVFVPGGTTGTLKACENPAIIAFLKDRGSRASFVSSVCTGSLVLGAAGLLKGYQATSHWLCRDQLSLFGATPVDQRVVIDRNRITGAGVTAGLDAGLQMVEQFRGKDYAQLSQLFAEYDPQPPYDCGSDSKAPKPMVDLLRTMHTSFSSEVKATAERVVIDQE